MQQYVVKITDAAMTDLETLYQYIATNLHAPQNALRQYNRIADAVLSLEMFPERCSLLEAEPWHSLGMRRLLVDRYSIFYFIREDTVLVTDILYSASDFINRLKGTEKAGT